MRDFISLFDKERVSFHSGVIEDEIGMEIHKNLYKFRELIDDKEKTDLVLVLNSMSPHFKDNKYSRRDVMDTLKQIRDIVLHKGIMDLAHQEILSIECDVNKLKENNDIYSKEIDMNVLYADFGFERIPEFKKKRWN